VLDNRFTNSICALKEQGTVYLIKNLTETTTGQITFDDLPNPTCTSIIHTKTQAILSSYNEKSPGPVRYSLLDLSTFTIDDTIEFPEKLASKFVRQIHLIDRGYSVICMGLRTCGSIDLMGVTEYSLHFICTQRFSFNAEKIIASDLLVLHEAIRSKGENRKLRKLKDRVEVLLPTSENIFKITIFM